MSSSSSTAVNPPTPNLSSLTSSTPSSSDFVFVSQHAQGAMTNAATIPVSMDQVQMSLSSLSHGLSLEEALMRVSDLMKENADLKAVLQQNNQAMKEQCQVLLSVKHQWGAEREEMKHKFDQTRTFMMDLRTTILQKDEQIKNLEEQLAQKLDQQTNSSREESLSASHSAEMSSLKQRRQVAETQAELHSAQNRFLQKQTDKLNERIETLIEEKARIEADNRKLTEENESIRKECEEMKTALKKQTELNEHLKVEKREVVSLNNRLNEQIHILRLGSKDTSPMEVSEPTSDVLFNKEFVMVQKSAQTAGSESESDQSPPAGAGPEREVPPGEEDKKLADALNALKLEQCKCAELGAKYAEQCTLVESLRRQVSEKDQLLVVTNEKLTTQLNILKKEHEEEMEQFRKQLQSQPNYEHTALQAQVMTLLHEVKETERKLTAALQSAEEYKKTCSELQASVSEYEGAKAQQSHNEQVLEGLQLQIASLEANLKLERSENLTKTATLQELRSSFDQLCNDYHELLSSSEEASSDMSKEKKSTSCQTGDELEQLRCDLIQKIDNLTAQLFTANDALNRSEEEIAKQKARVRQLEVEEIPVLLAQADIYKGDFEDERAAREKQQHEIMVLKENVQRLQQDLLKVMKQKHPPTPGAAAVPNPYDQGPYRSPSPNLGGDAAVEQLRCPMCQEPFPDQDSLQFHVNECLASDRFN